MSLFHFGIATEANNYETDTEDQIWIKNDKGELVEDKSYDNNKE